MISAERKSPLNSSTTTVSSFSCASSCLFPSSSSSSPTTATATTTEHRRRNRLSFPSSIVSLSFPSLSLLVVILAVLLCQNPVFAAPSSPSPHKWPTVKYNLDKQFQKTNFSRFKDNIFHDEMAQMDEPPRDLSQSVGVPKGWNKQPQNRIYYLRADNDQYMQFYQGQITGTKEINPPFGIVRFLSHKENIVILSYLENKYLCMNEDSVLYLTDTGDNPDCYIEEKDLHDNGSYNTVYYFTKYRRNMFYLGINCDPLLGRLADPNSKSSRFIRVVVSDEEAESAKEAVSKSGPDGSVRPKCESPADKRRAAKAKRQKLKWRWCWNFDRMVQKRHVYMDRCKKRERNRTCDNSHEDEEGPKKRCVCDILLSMLLNTKRTRRKCLVEKLSKWVENQNATAHSSAVLEASRLLVRNYPAISRRMRLLKARKNQKRQHHKALLDQKIPKDNQEVSSNHTTTANTQLVQTISSISHDQSSKRRRRRRRRRIIKLNSILGRYGRELFLASTSDDISEHWSATMETSGQSHISPSPKVKPPSVLSDDFKQALNALSPGPPRRHRGSHKRRKHRRRHHKSVPHPSQIIPPPPVGNANLVSAGSSSPG